MSRLTNKIKIVFLGFFLFLLMCVGQVLASNINDPDTLTLFDADVKTPSITTRIHNFFDLIKLGISNIFYMPELVIINPDYSAVPRSSIQAIPALPLPPDSAPSSTQTSIKVSTNTPRKVGVVKGVSTSAANSDASLLSALRRLLSQKEFVDLLRGPKGDTVLVGNTAMYPAQPVLSTQSPNSPAPIPSVFMPVGVSQPNPSVNFGGATFFGATDLSSKYFKTSEATIGTLNVTGNITGNFVGVINPSFTLGSIPFQGTTALAEDNANLFWDETNNRLGIGTNTPTVALDVVGDFKIDGSIVLPSLASGATPTSKYVKLATGESFMIFRDDVTYTVPGLVSGLDLFIGRNAGNLTATGGGNNIALGDSALTTLTSGFGNVAIGLGASYTTTSGNYNIAIGNMSLHNNTASGIVGVGYQTLRANTTGGFNTAFGNSALAGNTTGSYNTAIGADSQRNTTTSPTGSHNVSVGGATLRYLTTGSQNAAFGYHTGHSTSSGSNNSYLGFYAGRNNTEGSNNIFIGSNSGVYNGTASNQIFINSIDRLNYSGDQNESPIYIQQNATVASQLITFNGNVGINTISPSAALDVVGTVRFSGALMPDNTAGTSGQVLTSAGPGVVPTWTTLSPIATAMPISGLTAATGTNSINNSAYAQTWNWNTLSTAGGTALTLRTNGSSVFTTVDRTMLSVIDNDGLNHTGSAVGISSSLSGAAGFQSPGLTAYSYAGRFSSTTTHSVSTMNNIGIYATASGGTNNYAAIFEQGNVGIGTTSPGAKLDVNGDALINSLTVGKGAASGTTNTAFGVSTLAANSSGSGNTAIGYQALLTMSVSNNNTAVGSQALQSATGGANTALGSSAMLNNSTGNFNLGIGYGAGYGNNTGSSNVALGYQAGYGLSGSSNISNNIFLGYNAGFAVRTGANNNVIIGYAAADNLTTGAKNIIIGHDIDATTATTSNQLNIGNMIFGTSMDGTGTTLSTGNIGIGTTGPNYKLEVVGTFRASGNGLFGVNTSSGTTTPANLSLGGTYGTNTAGAVGNLKIDLYNDGTSNRSGFGISANKMEYQTPTGTIHAMYVGGVLIQSIDDNAVLIKSGLYSTSTYAHRIGNLLTQSYAANNITMVDNGYYNGSSWTRVHSGFASGIQMYNGHLSMVAGATGSGNFTPTYPFKANSAGTVGIGGDGGNVANTFTGNTLVATSTAVGVGDATPDYRFDVADTTIDNNIFSLTDSDGECLYNPEAGGVTVSCSSDARLKTNVVDAISALTYFSDFQIKDYNVIASGDATTGVIAQELLLTHPELVSLGADGLYKVEMPNQWKVIKSIQELDIKIIGLSSLDTANNNSLGSLIKQFLADVGNGLDSLFVKKIHTEELCVKKSDGSEVCVTGDRLEQILNGTANSSNGGGNTEEENTPSAEQEGNPPPTEPPPSDTPPADLPAQAGDNVPTP